MNRGTTIRRTFLGHTDGPPEIARLFLGAGAGYCTARKRPGRRSSGHNEHCMMPAVGNTSRCRIHGGYQHYSQFSGSPALSRPATI